MRSGHQMSSTKLPFSIQTAVFYVPLYCRARPRQAVRLFLWSLFPVVLLAAALQSIEIVQPVSDLMQPRFRPTSWTAILAVFFLLSLLAVWTMWLRALVRDEVASGMPLRLGPDEGRLIASVVLWQLAFWLIAIPVRALARIPVLGLLLVPLSTWVSVRIAPLAAYSVSVRRVVVFEAWRVTELVFWPALTSMAVNSVISLAALFTLGGILSMIGAGSLAATSGGMLSLPAVLLAIGIGGPVLTAILVFSLGPGCYMVWRHERRPRKAGPEFHRHSAEPDHTAPPAP